MLDGCRRRTRHHGLPPAAGHLQMEQNRTPAVLRDQPQLARTTPGISRGCHRNSQGNNHIHRTGRERGARHHHLRPRHQDHRQADRRPRSHLAAPSRVSRRLELHAHGRPHRDTPDITYLITARSLRAGPCCSCCLQYDAPPPRNDATGRADTILQRPQQQAPTLCPPPAHPRPQMAEHEPAAGERWFSHRGLPMTS